jgi:hypothetical protein
MNLSLKRLNFTISEGKCPALADPALILCFAKDIERCCVELPCPFVYQRCCPTDCGGTRCFPSNEEEGIILDDSINSVH